MPKKYIDCDVVLKEDIKNHSVDVVEVVRCKDCGNYNKRYGECNLNGSHFGENGFCSCGKRKGKYIKNNLSIEIECNRTSCDNNTGVTNKCMFSLTDNLIEAVKSDKPICGFLKEKVIRIAIDSIKKQIPQKAIIEREDFPEINSFCETYRCPICNKELITKDRVGFDGNLNKYCDCGQAIDYQL